MKRKVFYPTVFALAVFVFASCGSPSGREKAVREPAMHSMDTMASGKKNQHSIDSIAEAIWIKK